MKKLYLTARRQVKNQIRIEQQEAHVLSANENQSAANEFIEDIEF